MPPLPPLNFTGGAADSRGGTALSPWYQGDFVVSWAADARSGDRTAQPTLGALTGDGAAGAGLSIGAGAGGVSGSALLVAGAIVAGAMLWKLSR